MAVVRISTALPPQVPAIITNLGGASSVGGGGGAVNFSDNSTAGDATIANNTGTVAESSGGTVDFHNNATAGSATITDSGSSTPTADGGDTAFHDNSGAGSLRITNEGAKASPGGVTFLDNATAANAKSRTPAQTALLADGGRTRAG